MSDKSLSDLMESAGNPNAGAPTWKPKKDEVLAGTITEIKMVNSQFGESFTIEVTDEEGSAFTVWCSGVVLKGKILDAAPGKGSLIVITYGGKQKSKEGGREYALYDVTLDEEAETYGQFGEYAQAREMYEQRAALSGAPTVNVVNEGDALGTPF